VKQKLSARVRDRIDEEVRNRIDKVNLEYQTRVLAPLRTLTLAPTMIESTTAEDRMTMRVRLAATDQLAGHTPRPRAPSGSLASVQIHQSAFNNVLEKLELEGQRLTLTDLREWIESRLNCPGLLKIETDHDDMEITFSDRDAVTVLFQEGQIVITLSITELAKPPRRWSNFQVRAFYRPEVRGLSAVLARDGVIHLIGDSLGRSQIPLRTVFGKVFHRDRTWLVTPRPMATDPRLAGLKITQFVVEEGWIGVALGPRRSYRYPMAARPSSEGLD
jgi:hypothetical protein